MVKYLQIVVYARSMVKPRFANAALKPYLANASLQMVATDFIGPLPQDGGRRFILVIIDGFLDFLKPVPSET